MKMQRTKTMGAAACALLLCAAMVAGMTSLGAGDAHAEGSASEDVASTSATKNVEVGWYATVTEPVELGNTESGFTTKLYPGSYARGSSGNWINLAQYGVQASGGAAYIAEEDLPALEGVMFFPQSPGASEDGITWWHLYKIVEEPDPITEPNPTENKGTEPTKPDTGRTPDVTEAEKPPTTPEKPTEPAPTTNPTNPVPQLPVTGNKTPEVESEIFSLRCRESEAEIKIAELEAQGYEIIRVDKLPKWFR